jgi:hypothetical protein
MTTETLTFTANAVNYTLNLTISGPGPTGTVTAISGTVGSTQITGIDASYTGGNGFTPDNKISSASAPFVDFSGISFDTASAKYNITEGFGGPSVLETTNNGSTTQNGYSVSNVALTACFVTGTHIATPTGTTAVEALHIGDTICLANGTHSQVTWIGHRHIDITRHPNPPDVLPIRVLQDAFAEGIPARDLWLSPDHAVFANGALIPVRYLINDATIIQEPADHITYWHVELEHHSILLAENLPCESYLDTGNRTAFDNATPTMLHPNFAPPATQDARAIWATQACAPLVESGPELQALRTHLDHRAGPLLPEALTLTLTQAGQTHHHLPANTTRLRLISPCTTPPGERRRLGAAIAAITIDGTLMPLNHPGFATGFHPPEPDFRWTDGDAILLLTPQPHDRTLTVSVAMLAAKPQWAAA